MISGRAVVEPGALSADGRQIALHRVEAIRAAEVTTFSRTERDVLLLSDPVLVMRSPAQHWATFAPAGLAINDTLGKALLGAVLLTDAAVTTQLVRGVWRTGFVGDAELALTHTAAPGVSAAFAALLRLATIAGVDAQTTYGFGEVSPAMLDELPHPHRADRDTRSTGPAVVI